MRVDIGKHSNGVTIIDSKGYNNCGVGAIRKLERGQKLTYSSSSGGGGGSNPNRTMTITFAGTGTGTVSGNAVSCAPTCSFSDGSNVTFTATPTGGSTFTGWSGNCSGSGTCTINPMNADKAATATFAAGGGSTGTLGYNTIGGTTDFADRNTISGSRFTMGASAGTATSISVYVASVDPSASNKSYQMAIYTNSGSNPGTKVSETSIGTLSVGWNTLPITGALSANTSYWLIYNTNASSDSNNNYKFDSGGTYVYKAQTFGTMPSTFGTPDGSATNKVSIYVTYSIP